MRKILILIIGVILGIVVSFMSIYLVNGFAKPDIDYEFEMVNMDDERIKRYITEGSYDDMLDEMRQYKNCRSSEEAIKVATQSEYFQKYNPREGKIYVAYDNKECLYIIVFPLKNTEYACRIIVDEFTEGIVQVAKIR